ncbi:MAG TPA: GNAT family N-acetyltransferase [Ktedonobacteraceae bacterium]|nr:GNAT family N-acetyltransferase [Ktedonobacteraceae bacterium]
MTSVFPTDFSIRPPVEADLNNIAHLFVSRETFFYSGTELNVASEAQWLQSSWQFVGADPAHDACAIFAPDGQGVGYVHVWRPEESSSEFYASPRVSPQYLHLGIGTYLLQWAEQRMQQILPTLPSQQQVKLHSWIAGVDTAAEPILEHAGFRAVRYFWRMDIEMAQAPQPPVLPEGIHIRAYNPDQDTHRTYEALEEAFQDLWGYAPQSFEKWSHWGIDLPSFDPTLTFLAIDGQQIAGVLMSRIDKGEQRTSGWVDDLGIRRPWRKQGLGLALLQHAFGEFYRRGIPRCGLSVDGQNPTGATRLYTRAGMHRAKKFDVLYEKALL